ncbi:gas vesicle protein GvpG [Micromonospora soli]|uniref:gas vesicle protein GvpG n=1 Tax=Micromonospora sp. NBRC 110009 TaxID=3061627 RepID=UPI0026741A9C|nr:gas vesicle protein GvpG [Micromonospora sp. NBRC 110009]WKU01382.1 gas vesicle protein GvpG [Micromonospora sp. NBRC 110009]
MDILWGLLTLPYAPVRGLTAAVKVIAREAESQQYNPVNIRRELEELDRAAAAGEITPEERDRGQQRVLERLTVPAGDPGRTPSQGTTGTGRRPPPARRRRADRQGEQRRR